ncbi:tetratricopeptide repeat protein 1-like [Durio zibethinus]|uniref:Tetratricopeptide repeat protein 1-like n=1 Tax=Durio zibethinus TaxID=66656 RepID=A0A6P5ZGK8_DURZI|nr:tetratricopeptide repeat protein 1-like [Durio zibethinus]
MVLIETHHDEQQQQQATKAIPSSSETTSDTVDAASSNVGGGDAASDGFETASERDVSDNEEEDHAHDQQSSEQKGPDSYQDALNDDELEEKALAQANDAKMEGNKLFGNGHYEEALLQYGIALQVTEEMPTSVEIRSICHSNRGVCFLKLGKYEETIKECTKALELNPSYVKALVRRGEAHEKLQHFEEAIADMTKILELDPSNEQARKAIRRLEPLAAEKREKMKEEMIGKLKELGNSVLGRFGMSVDNFKAVKDPNTGSYSISFQR